MTLKKYKKIITQLLISGFLSLCLTACGGGGGGGGAGEGDVGSGSNDDVSQDNDVVQNQQGNNNASSQTSLGLVNLNGKDVDWKNPKDGCSWSYSFYSGRKVVLTAWHKVDFPGADLTSSNMYVGTYSTGYIGSPNRWKVECQFPWGRSVMNLEVIDKVLGALHARGTINHYFDDTGKTELWSSDFVKFW